MKKGDIMVRAELYDKNKTYILGNNSLGDYERIRTNHPAVDVIPHVAITDESGTCLLALDPLPRRRGQLGVDPELSDEDAILAIEYIENNPHVPEYDPTPEERIAAALEFQNVMALPDAEE